jgi:DNA-binding transcriptional MerR regulator
MAESPTPNLAASPSGGHLSIGEVLALLLEEFPDVTISKIRFLESQGLIDPERTASGYRKFYADDVELLRCILREQRENYLPLRVIKDRIDSGEIDPSGEQTRPAEAPRGIKNVGRADDVPQPGSHPSAGRSHREPSPNGAVDEPATGAAALFQRTDGAAPDPSTSEEPPPVAAVATSAATTAASPTPSAPSDTSAAASSGPIESAGAVLPGVLLDADELCAMARITRTQLAELESYGVVAGTSRGDGGPYNEDDVEIATISKRFLDAGIEPRHLRGWRVAADREAGLLEQLIQPLLRQRNPEARAQAIAQLTELEETGGRLRSAMMRSTLQQHAP